MQSLADRLMDPERPAGGYLRAATRAV